MPDHPIERYAADMGEIRGTRSNVPETSFYSALERLLSDIGKTLSPKVRCVINLANRGAGIPRGGHSPGTGSPRSLARISATGIEPSARNASLKARSLYAGPSFCLYSALSATICLLPVK